MKKVSIPNIKGHNLRSILKCFYELFKGLSDKQVLFDVSALGWAYPLLILPLAAYMQKTNSEITGVSNPISSYFSCIRFPGGTDQLSDFELLSQRAKKYIPISRLRSDDSQARERLESAFIDLVFDVLASQESGVRSGIGYPISELITNLVEHSHSDGLTFGQYYPTKQFLDICILDTGRGLAASYLEEKGIDISDTKAIEEAMTGHSTKANKERGYGLRTSKRLVCEGMNGEFVLLSGATVFFSNQKNEIIVPLPDFYWQGVIAAYRIPKPNQSLEFYNYME